MRDSLANRYQVLVCGAGPAGLVAAMDLAQAGLKTALLDRRDPWREPVACAEAVSKGSFQALVPDYDPQWIRGPVNGVVFVSPNGTQVQYNQKDSGYILDRALMHRGLAERAQKAGAHCHFRAQVQNIQSKQGLWEATVVLDGSQTVHIEADVILDCTGPGGRLTRQIPGLELLEDGSRDLEVGVFTILEGIEHRTDLIEMFFGSKYFPGGYGWVFPRDGKSVNVGLVIGREYVAGNPPRKLLADWIQATWPGIAQAPYHGGAIACGQSRKALGQNGVFKAGDAAGQVNPISRSGIVESMKGGRLIASHIPEWLQATPERRRQIESSLVKEWFDIQGSTHERLDRAKGAFGSIPDAVYNSAAERIVRIPVEKRTLPRIFFTTLLRSPALLWRMRSLMGL